MSRFSHSAAARNMALLLLTAAAAAGAYADDAAFTSRAGVGSMTGAQIYDHICSGCHMAGGQGAVGAGFYPKLAANKKLVSWEHVALTVLNGRNGMPPFGLPADQVMETRAAHLSDAQIADVVNYVRSHFGNKYKADVTAAEIAALPHPATALMGPQ
ncbi:MAG: c-type cytochrome [Steroidobacteraceae bacterium]